MKLIRKMFFISSKHMTALVFALMMLTFLPLVDVTVDASNINFSVGDSVYFGQFNDELNSDFFQPETVTEVKQFILQGGPSAGSVLLIHEETTTGYDTIQEAVNAAGDGDIVDVTEGVFTEQITINKNITLQGAGRDKTIIRSPDRDELTQTWGDWKNLKNQDVFALIGIKTNTSGQVVIKDLTVDGRDQGYLPDSLYGDKNSYAFQGIGIYNSNAVIDFVKVTGVRESVSDYGLSIPAGYVDQPAGMNHNEGIFAESAEGAGMHKVTITNSIVTRFQKTAILAWGPTLEVDINNNTIQGYGKTIYSTGNAIQIASNDRSGMGGANGDRRGTIGSIKDNNILDIGIIVPPFGLPGYYFNPNLGGSTGILLWEAGEGIEIRGNVITRDAYIPSWHNGDTSSDGGYSNVAISVYGTPQTLIKNNTIYGFDSAIMEYAAPTGSKAVVEGNLVKDEGIINGIDIWTSFGDDEIVLTDDKETIAFNQTGNGIDTLTGFGLGDIIYVVGFESGSVNGCRDDGPIVKFDGGTVTEGDGSNVAAKSLQLGVDDNVTTLYIDTEGDADRAELEIKLNGVYTPQNLSLADGDKGFIKYAPLPLTVNTCSPSDGADGVAVDAQLVLTFNQDITAVAGKNILIKNASNDEIVATIAATDEKVSVSGAAVTVSLPEDLYYCTDYYVEIDHGAFEGDFDNAYAGIADQTTWNFTTEIRSEVTAGSTEALAHYMENSLISVINLVYGTTYQYEGGAITRDLTIDGNGAEIVAGTGVVDTVVRSDGITVSSDALPNYANIKTFLKVEGVDSGLTLKDVTLRNGINKNGTDNADDGLFTVINVKTGGSLEMNNVTIEGFHNNPAPGNNLSFGIHGEPGAASTIIKDSKFDSSNAFRNAVAIRKGGIVLDNNTFEGTDYPERLRQSDGYEYAIYIYTEATEASQRTPLQDTTVPPSRDMPVRG